MYFPKISLHMKKSIFNTLLFDPNLFSTFTYLNFLYIKIFLDFYQLNFHGIFILYH